jgi:hypothetical protein
MNCSGTIDMTADQMAAKPSGKGQSSFKVYRISALKFAKSSSQKRLRHNIRCKK